VDDLEILCEDNFKLTKFSCYLGRIYGPKLNMCTGKRHDYIEVNMEFNDNGKLDVSMMSYLKKGIADFSEAITRKQPLLRMITSSP
jgi:hypothetical protein